MSSLRGILIIQGLLIFLCGWCCQFFWGSTVAWSCWDGGLVAMAPMWLCGGLLLWAEDGHGVVRWMYVGELLKWFGTAILFLALIFFVHPIWWACFLGFVLAQASLYVAALCWAGQGRT